MTGREVILKHNRIPPGYYRKAIKTNPFQRYWHQRRFAEIKKLIEPVKGEILDIGSCDGTFTEVIATKSGTKRIIGIDCIASSVAYAQKRFKKDKRYRFLVADATKLPFADNRFEAVFCLEVLEHIINPEKVMKEARRVLQPGGYLIILVPTDNRLFKIIWWIVLQTWGRHWQETHVHSFNQPGSLKKALEKAGYRVEIEKKFILNMLEAVKARK